MDHRIHQIQQHYTIQTPPIKKSNQESSVNFKEVLSDFQHIKVSKHAEGRLQERNIKINEKQWQTICKKVSEAKQKGVTDSLVVTHNAALLVSAKNNTVVTAMNREEATDKIFTNINGTILIHE